MAEGIITRRGSGAKVVIGTVTGKSMNVTLGFEADIIIVWTFWGSSTTYQSAATYVGPNATEYSGGVGDGARSHYGNINSTGIINFVLGDAITVSSTGFTYSSTAGTPISDVDFRYTAIKL